MIDSLLNGADWSQNNRLLVLHTPAGPDAFLAETVQIREAIGPTCDHTGFVIDMTALSADAHHDLTTLLGQPVRLDLQTSQSRTELRPFHGHITQITRVGANAGFGRYQLKIEPWLAFLNHRRDSVIYQDRTVFDIVEQVLGSWQQAKLVPDWRWEIADRELYPTRSITTQYQETDLAFVRRLLVEEGLFCWFEHTGDDSDVFGKHTLVIADHNEAFVDNIQPAFRFTQPGATLSEDSLDRWHGSRRLDSSITTSASWDYRTLDTRPQSAPSRIDNGSESWMIEAVDDPGQYAWETSAQGNRRIDNQRQALDARAKLFTGEGTVRTAMPGSIFRLDDHEDHAGDEEEHRRFAIVEITHQARNNLNERVPDAMAALGDRASLFDEVWGDAETSPDLYRNRLTAVRVNVPWRPLDIDGHGRFIHPKPTIDGTQTAIVVGDGAPTHTDRDHRVRVQFHWQRGANAANRRNQPNYGDNAPASDRLGTWVRVATPVAGANWGGHLIPRPGQEVLVAFLHGNIDRPVVVGAVYNGQGQADAAGNQRAQGGSQSSANAPAFFAGKAEPHAHTASLSGIKTQALQTSRSGQGGFNQLVFDDAPGEARIELGSTQFDTWLQLGHLKQQDDNERLAARGHGVDLTTQASAALRAGAGVLISADARRGASSAHLDSREPIDQTGIAKDLTVSLADVAAKQNAALANDPAAKELPVSKALEHALEVLESTDNLGEHSESTHGEFKATLGGSGTVPAWSEPRIQYAAPGGIAQLTPANAFLVAGKTTSITTSQDTNFVTQANQSVAIRSGLSMFTIGKAENGSKPNTETGIHLHAASGKVSMQSQSDQTKIAAEKKVTITSTHASTHASAKGHLLATAQGAYIKLEGGNIEVHAPGEVKFKASQKNFTGPADSTGLGLDLPDPKDLYDELFVIRDETSGEPRAFLPYRIEDETGAVLASGLTNADGQTVRVQTGFEKKTVRLILED
ncbi:type VI secretion system Vgr family protein [Thiosocius teredinicola]|uniref:type VI secretion system Vgr family protein n=1 Tax=Thiosocius teredinicola TaxID=1973002 RepID=UPI002FE4E5B9